MDFVNFPDAFRLQILKKLHWRDLNNLKLACKNLYFTVVKYIEKLHGPRVEYEKIPCVESKRFGANYGSMYFEIIEGHIVPHHIGSNDDNEYEIFLKGKDFTGIKKFRLGNLSDRERISIGYRNPLGRDISIFNFAYRLPNTKSLMIYLSTVVSCSREFAVLSDDNFLRQNLFKHRDFLEKTDHFQLGKKLHWIGSSY
uniref:F-box domain-containing protein n=1 Tax=Strongyloides papillosus TaxID=174720 RepID=A0A0N5BI54_STREA